MVLSIAKMVMDVFILLLPLPIIVPLQMAPRQKASLILLFATASAGVAMKLTMMLPGLLDSQDYSWEAVERFIWCFFEVNAGIVCASVPALTPFNAYLPSIIVSRLSSNRGDSTAGGGKGSRRSCALDPVVAQNLERRRMQNESYVLSSRDDCSIPDAKSGVENSEEAKRWDGYHENARAATGAHVRDLRSA
ncbi:hypothetical protein CTA2_8204 [Colletotrichum tanaceti]|uniref:Rhodopsin domain-containing protein n=1 Tax=Colletotrichum tanaceti TaxID=1306861 RepID=A0A4U6XCL0_9PEZI|nr:hypothetical protein CTA2_8204 [Colletotrichum tanaceti]TKW53335.1 hypothetical protein CTA1_8220 [Colletotrichum tanaceti]